MRNSKRFVKIVEGIRLQETDMLVSFDVTSLITMILVKKATAVIRQKFESQNLLEEWADLTEFCLSTTFFQFRNKWYEQMDGAAMGLPLFLIAVNIFMEAI